MYYVVYDENKPAIDFATWAEAQKVFTDLKVEGNPYARIILPETQLADEMSLDYVF